MSRLRVVPQRARVKITACRLFSRRSDFHARSRFARSTIPEEIWGNTRSLSLEQTHQMQSYVIDFRKTYYQLLSKIFSCASWRKSVIAVKHSTCADAIKSLKNQACRDSNPDLCDTGASLERDKLTGQLGDDH